VWVVGRDHRAHHPHRKQERRSSTVAAFLAAGLPAADIVQMAHVADAKPGIYKRWSYFCGCCWTRIRQIQERAAEIIAEVGDN